MHLASTSTESISLQARPGGIGTADAAGGAAGDAAVAAVCGANILAAGAGVTGAPVLHLQQVPNPAGAAAAPTAVCGAHIIAYNSAGRTAFAALCGAHLLAAGPGVAGEPALLLLFNMCIAVQECCCLLKLSGTGVWRQRSETFGTTNAPNRKSAYSSVMHASTATQAEEDMG